MKNNAGGQAEHNEPTVQDIERAAASSTTRAELILLDYLVDRGFIWEEATKLIHLREHLYENSEMHQRIAEDTRMQFIRWLYENGEIKEA